MVRLFVAFGLMAFAFRLETAADTTSLPPFAWPVTGQVVDEDDGRPSAARAIGIDILVPKGTEVRASLAGTVIYADKELRTFGNLVLLRHDGGWVTVYGHNDELFVNRGDEVAAGDVIAKSGETGFTARPELYFEIRKGATALNPLQYLGRLKPQEPEPP